MAVAAGVAVAVIEGGADGGEASRALAAATEATAHATVVASAAPVMIRLRLRSVQRMRRPRVRR
jgi:hypothetical protein